MGGTTRFEKAQNMRRLWAGNGKDEIALSRKLIDPDTEELYCITCMAENFGCTEEDLRAKIQEFKEQGCTLFL